ncbi:hypothetical protein [Streptococcus salivarius]|jgi:hypothetical protein|uniref:hypothetical protein n=1 Tax=Streptococcus salivarius TaxID=1304 RepID=UPI00066A4572|nr:hypothetical protein [Streptococcus salivarius]
MPILKEFGGAMKQGVKQSLSSLYYDGFDDAASTVFNYFEWKKKTLNSKIRKGQYLNEEEQYLLAQIDVFLEELDKEFKKTVSTQGPKI